MKSRQNIAWVFVVLLPLLLTACGPSAEQRLIGTWQADTSEKAEQAKAAAEGTPMAGLVAKMTENLGFTIRLQEEGKMSFQVKMGAITIDTDGEWKVLDENGDEATIETRYNRPNNGEQVVEKTTISFETGDRIRMKPPGDRGETMYFDRVTED